ncbi:Hypothetical protein WLH_00985 [Escherichia coli O25b:H4]|uniref:Uncharacterized protein n=1 Tax=Escherichia coli O25b:H4 TaxID=941280 RepID=A0A192C991_ECO25|nr:Hypothetical protein WLH_00985 [Escherichia coli O25b:H4]
MARWSTRCDGIGHFTQCCVTPYNFSNEALSVVHGHHSGGVGPAVNRRIVSCRPGQPTWMWAEGAFYRDVTSRPYPIAERNKMREPRQRRFTAGSPGCQGGGD